MKILQEFKTEPINIPISVPVLIAGSSRRQNGPLLAHVNAMFDGNCALVVQFATENFGCLATAAE